MTTNNGLLLIDKPKGLTSHDVVAHVRKVLNEQRVGHAGTLDPMATGLLVLAVGPSTRLLRFAQSETKRYEGVVTFGVRTDSLDADGEVLERQEVPALSDDTLNAEAASMLGSLSQIPPMVSALKVNGRRLHALAREGIVVEREPRDVTIEAFTLAPTSRLDEWTFDVTCSVGTYVRVLLSDLAERLGTIGHLSVLRRLSSGKHDVHEALSFDQLDQRVAKGEVVLQPPRAFTTRLEETVVSEDEERRLRMGQRVALVAPVSDEIAALNAHGDLVAVLHRRGESWQPDVVLPAQESDENG
jgi:tRNA pseudouridine55 synthase